MRRTFMGGVCLLALAAAGTDQASAARHRSNCASATEVTSLQTAAVQQELMDAALGCGDEAMHNFNAFQTSYSAELRKSDKTLLAMFKRIDGPARGDAAYNLFKTNMASKAEIRRVHQITDFCATAKLAFDSALRANKPSLAEFVSGVQIADSDDAPVGKCAVTVAMTLQGVAASPTITPKPNPMRSVAEVQPSPSTLGLTTDTVAKAEQPMSQPTSNAPQAH
ncbi:MAG: hypothetical protein WDM89_21445 [Rhizomicrobium sp.]